MVKNSAINKDTDSLVTLTDTQELTNKTLVTPTIASMVNAGHTHEDAAGGGQIDEAALSAAITPAKGGTGLTTIAEGDVLVGGATNTITTIAKSTTVGDVLGINGSNAIAWITPAATGFVWVAAPADVTAEVAKGYISTKGSLLTLTLPTTAAVGDVIRLTNQNSAGSWRLQAGTGVTVRFGSVVTKAAGSLSSNDPYDAVEVVCVVANTGWQVVSSIGNITVETV